MFSGIHKKKQLIRLRRIRAKHEDAMTYDEHLKGICYIERIRSRIFLSRNVFTKQINGISIYPFR